MLLKASYILLLSFTIVSVNTANILAYFPCPSISHQVVFRPITLELIKRGHTVTVLTTDPIFPKGETPANLTEIDLHDVSYNLFRRNLQTFSVGKTSDVIQQVNVMKEITPRMIEEQMDIAEVKELINSKTKKFDLILVEAFFMIGLGITHVFKAPTVLVSSFGPFFGNYEVVGAPTHPPLLYRNAFSQKLYNMTIWEKLNELYTQVRIKYTIFDFEDKQNKALKRIFGPDVPTINELKNEVEMLFLNIYPIWEGNYPVPPAVVHMGGLHQKPPKELPKELSQLLDDSPNGVIYFSFGTNVRPSLLDPAKIDMFHKVFAELPYNVIWKWDDESLKPRSDNVRIFRWLPQSDLLRHPNIKLFITQGGLQSTDEAITAGVPLVGIPMLGDQWYNVEKYVYHKIGVRLDFEELTEEKLKNALLDVAGNESYRNNIVRLRNLMQDQPQKPLERTIWWLEYILRHGGAKHLRSPAANISWSEYLELELVSFILIFLFTSLILVVLVTRYIFRKLFQLYRNYNKEKVL
ncbi:UDP-glycosyltransferase UGT5-like [Papilio machaon]|uniref:UDP-glycosyltransferase UGT5-like n=1 Tax=Papilio machaon TaxID=76193 RepID=UPI001E662B9C|nr:UDP-glycosyltransferase UGT5-like [Papilio machaon]